MRMVKQFVITIGLCLSVCTLAQAETAPNEFRGGLLYSTHCNACHTSTIHWREQKLATDWESLKFQVNRWQKYTKLGWGDEDINDVALYLNMHYYNFLNVGSRELSQNK